MLGFKTSGSVNFSTFKYAYEYVFPLLNFYDNNFGCEDFLRIIDWMPYFIELDFESSCNEMESECPSYSFKLIGKQEHCYIEKKFKVK